MKNEEMKAIELLEKYNQHHIVVHLKRLNENDKEKLIKQIKEIDIEEVIKLYEKTKIKRKIRDAKIEPLKATIANEMEQEQKNEYIAEGEKVLKENKFAAVTLAGGQGTRLRT